MSLSKTIHCNISDSGYTLIELLAVIAIMGIMAAVAVTSYSENKKSAALDKAVQQFVMDLRSAQNMAMNTAVFSGAVPAGGYGIYISRPLPLSTYIIYADFSGDKQYNVPLPIVDGIVATKTFDSPISISAISNTNVVSIDFLPPNPDIYYNGLATTMYADRNITFTITYGSAGPSKNVILNGLTGQISVN